MKFFNNCKMSALIAALALLLTGCVPKTADLVAEVGKAMEAGLPLDFKKLEFEVQSYRGMQPAMVFEGKNATILEVTKPVHVNHPFIPDDVKLSGLAITKNGHYFTFSYESGLTSPDSLPFVELPCLASGCRRITEARQATRAEAMQWFFYSSAFTPGRFKQLFNEDAPPQRVDA